LKEATYFKNERMAANLMFLLIIEFFLLDSK